MTGLLTEPRLHDPDDFFESLLELHRGLDDAESRKVDAKLILLLANHVGDPTILEQALELARPRR